MLFTVGKHVLRATMNRQWCKYHQKHHAPFCIWFILVSDSYMESVRPYTTISSSEVPWVSSSLSEVQQYLDGIIALLAWNWVSFMIETYVCSASWYGTKPYPFIRHPLSISASSLLADALSCTWGWFGGVWAWLFFKVMKGLFIH